jgi:hypothetical protein
MALDQFVNTVKTLSSQGSLTELCDFLNKQVIKCLKRFLLLDSDLDAHPVCKAKPGKT